MFCLVSRRVCALAGLAYLSGALLCAQELIFSPSTLNFTITADSLNLPAAQEIRIGSSSGAPTSFRYLGSGILDNVILRKPPSPIRVKPASGATPSTLLVDLDPEVISQFPVFPGRYYLSFSTGSESPPGFFAYVNLTILNPPPPVITSVLNAASLSGGPIAPNEIVILLGAHTTALY